MFYEIHAPAGVAVNTALLKGNQPTFRLVMCTNRLKAQDDIRYAPLPYTTQARGRCPRGPASYSESVKALHSPGSHLFMSSAPIPLTFSRRSPHSLHRLHLDHFEYRQTCCTSCGTFDGHNASPLIRRKVLPDLNGRVGSRFGGVAVA